MGRGQSFILVYTVMWVIDTGEKAANPSSTVHPVKPSDQGHFRGRQLYSAALKANRGSGSGTPMSKANGSFSVQWTPLDYRTSRVHLLSGLLSAFRVLIPSAFSWGSCGLFWGGVSGVLVLDGNCFSGLVSWAVV